MKHLKKFRTSLILKLKDSHPCATVLYADTLVGCKKFSESETALQATRKQPTFSQHENEIDRVGPGRLRRMRFHSHGQRKATTRCRILAFVRLQISHIPPPPPPLLHHHHTITTTNILCNKKQHLIKCKAVPYSTRHLQVPTQHRTHTHSRTHIYVRINIHI